MAMMTQVTQWRVEPTKYLTFIEAANASKAIYESHGATVFVTNQVSGPDAGAVAVMLVFESSAAYGAALDSIQADPKWTEWVGKYMTSGIATVVSVSTFRAVPWIS
jgi:hypothetical protein